MEEERNWNKTIFLAHASEDKEVIRNIYNQLKSNGIEPWLDEVDIPAGAKWDDEIRMAIKQSRFLLALLSKHSTTKDGYIQREFRRALDITEEKASGNIYLIPALLDDVQIPDIRVNNVSLSDFQAVKLYESGGMERLIKELQLLIGKIEPKENEETARASESTNERVQEIQALIAQGDMLKGLENLLDYVKLHKSDYINDVIHQLGRYNRLRNMYDQGVITFSDMSPEEAKIRLAVNNLLGELTV